MEGLERGVVEADNRTRSGVIFLSSRSRFRTL